MNRRLRHAGLGLLALSLVVTAAARAETATSIRSVTAADMQWTKLRPGLDRILLLGDPATSGPFVYRIRAPAGLDLSLRHRRDRPARLRNYGSLCRRLVTVRFP